MKLKVIRRENESVIVIEGSLDARSCMALDTALGHMIEKKVKRIVVDCRNLDYISSAGIGVFISYLRDIHEKNIDLMLMGVPLRIKRIFSTLGLDQLIPMNTLAV